MRDLGVGSEPEGLLLTGKSQWLECSRLMRVAHGDSRTFQSHPCATKRSVCPATSLLSMLISHDFWLL